AVDHEAAGTGVDPSGRPRTTHTSDGPRPTDTRNRPSPTDAIGRPRTTDIDEDDSAEEVA
ncbi:MAG: hypothetical protein WD638_02590, partial [Nitriliruptoraceae bacterium]